VPPDATVPMLCSPTWRNPVMLLCGACLSVSLLQSMFGSVVGWHQQLKEIVWLKQALFGSPLFI
jgi:hypothetical protein